METTDKNGRYIKVGDYVKVVNRITGSIEDSGKITKIDGRQVHLGVGTNIIGMLRYVVISEMVIKNRIVLKTLLLQTLVYQN